MLVGIARFIAEYSYGKLSCGDEGPDPTPAIIKNFHYLYFSVFLFVVTGLVAVVVSLFTKPVDKRCLYRLTFWSRHSREARIDIDEWMRNKSKSVRIGSDLSSGSCEQELQTLKTGTENSDKLQQLDNPTDKRVTQNGEREERIVRFDHLEKSGVPDVECKHNESKKPWYRCIGNWMCGLENMEQINQKQVERVDMLCIRENRRWKIMSNIAAVGSMVLMVMIAVYFA